MQDVSLFIHSTATLPSMWNGVPAEVLGTTTPLAPANLGYPPNAPVPRGARVDVEDEVRHLLAQLPPDLQQLDVYAHSYGAAVAMLLAQRLGAKVRSLFLLEPVVFGALMAAGDESDPEAVAQAIGFRDDPRFLKDLDFGGTEPWLERFIDYWNRPGSWQRLPDGQKAFIRSVGWKMFQEVRSCAYDIPSFDACLLPRVPTTFAYGKHTTAGSRAMTEALLRRHPHARRAELSAGHMAPLTHPHLVHEAMRAHVAARDARP